jgi:hypothetical protein
MEKDYDVLIEWEAPARVYKKRGKEYFSTIAAIVFLLTVVLFFLREFVLIALVFTFAFFTYVLATVKPEKIKNQLTKKGVKVANKFFFWEELTDFWVDEKYGYTITHVVMPLRSPGRVILLIDKGKEKEMLKILSDRLVYHEKPIKSWVDRAADWLTTKVNLDKK